MRSITERGTASVLPASCSRTFLSRWQRNYFIHILVNLKYTPKFFSCAVASECQYDLEQTSRWVIKANEGRQLTLGSLCFGLGEFRFSSTVPIYLCLWGMKWLLNTTKFGTVVFAHHFSKSTIHSKWSLIVYTRSVSPLIELKCMLLWLARWLVDRVTWRFSLTILSHH